MGTENYMYETLDCLPFSDDNLQTYSVTYMYETLDCLPFSDDNLQTYSVLRNRINATLPVSPKATAVDYFSLDVDESENENKWDPETKVDNSETLNASDGKEDKVLVPETSWFRAGRKFKSPMLQLHKEIIDFCNFISPTLEEETFRTAAIDRVFEVVRYVWPHCRVEVFGSFRTGLYLPTSDIDAVVFDSKVKTPQMGLYALARALSQRTVGKNIQVIAKSRVPIIKFVEKQSGIAFDIRYPKFELGFAVHCIFDEVFQQLDEIFFSTSFDAQNGPSAADFIKDAVSKMPPLKPLCMILKIFLQQRELNEVFLGGIGSYALLTMLIAHLQIHWRGQDKLGNPTSAEHNLGILLVSFFDMYGRKLNIRDVGISCNAAGTFFSKSRKRFSNDDRPGLLCIEDPQAPDNDIGRGSFNYYKVRSAFGMAYSTLTDAKTIMELGSEKSMLGAIIRPDPLLLERKGGHDGDLTFESLISGAEEKVPLRFGDRGDVFFDWRLVDDEPLPRGKCIEETNSYTKKKKGSKSKSTSDNTACVTTPDVMNRENLESRKKKQRKREHEFGNGVDGKTSVNLTRKSKRDITDRY